MAEHTVRKTLTLSFLFRRDGPALWSAQCLETATASVGTSYRHAQAMLLEAVGMVLIEDILTGHDPFDRRADLADWRVYKHCMNFGERFTDDQVGELAAVVSMPVLLELEVTTDTAVTAGRPRYTPHVAADPVAMFAEAA